jgi:hypothetical protein
MRYLIMYMLVAASFTASAQTKTTEALEKKFSSRTFFLYHNTLRAINQSENPAFDELIKDIEKMKVIWVNKKEKNFTNDNFKTLISDYKSESFEEIMTSRHEGKNFNVLVKEKDGKTRGVLVTVNDTESVYIMDIVGSIALNNITQLFKTLDDSSDIGERIKMMTNKNQDKAEDKADH